MTLKGGGDLCSTFQELLVVEVGRVDLSEDKSEYSDEVTILGNQLLSVGDEPIRGLNGELDGIQDDSVDDGRVVVTIDGLIRLKWVIGPLEHGGGFFAYGGVSNLPKPFDFPVVLKPVAGKRFVEVFQAVAFI